MKLGKNHKLYILIGAMLLFAIVIIGTYVIKSERVSLSNSGQVEFTEQESSTTQCNEDNTVAQNDSECLFIGCNGFF